MYFLLAPAYNVVHVYMHVFPLAIFIYMAQHKMFVFLLLTISWIASTQSVRIIKNEDDLIGTCTGTCGEIPTLHNKLGCIKLSDCQKSSSGWNRGFVRCDNCNCECQKQNENKDTIRSKTSLSATEPDIYGTCTGTCSMDGLVKSNYGGCEEVRDCSMERSGWTKGFVRCDYCTCVCINTYLADKYELTNVKYDLSAAALDKGKPSVMGSTIIDNGGSSEQTVERTIGIDVTDTTSVSNSHSIDVGTSVTVEAGVGVGDFSFSTSVETSFLKGFNYESSSSTEKTISDSVTATIVVPPHSSVKVLVTGKSLKLNVPYTADLLITFKDGSTKTEKTTGLYTDVTMGEFRVQYEAATPYPPGTSATPYPPGTSATPYPPGTSDNPNPPSASTMLIASKNCFHLSLFVMIILQFF